MSNQNVGVIKDPNYEIIEGVNKNLETVHDSRIKELFYDFIDEMEEDNLSISDKRRIWGVINYATEQININLNAKGVVCNKFFVKSEESLIRDVDCILEGIVLISKNEYEEEKIKYYGNLFANVLFQESLNKDEIIRLIKISGNLS